jgi:hypothetical protein
MYVTLDLQILATIGSNVWLLGGLQSVPKQPISACCHGV